MTDLADVEGGRGTREGSITSADEVIEILGLGSLAGSRRVVTRRVSFEGGVIWVYGQRTFWVFVGSAGAVSGSAMCGGMSRAPR